MSNSKGSLPAKKKTARAHAILAIVYYDTGNQQTNRLGGEGFGLLDAADSDGRGEGGYGRRIADVHADLVPHLSQHLRHGLVSLQATRGRLFLPSPQQRGLAVERGRRAFPAWAEERLVVRRIAVREHAVEDLAAVLRVRLLPLGRRSQWEFGSMPPPPSPSPMLCAD